MPHRSTEGLTNESMAFSKSLATRSVGQNQLTTEHYALLFKYFVFDSSCYEADLSIDAAVVYFPLQESQFFKKPIFWYWPSRLCDMFCLTIELGKFYY